MSRFVLYDLWLHHDPDNTYYNISRIFFRYKLYRWQWNHSFRVSRRIWLLPTSEWLLQILCLRFWWTPPWILYWRFNVQVIALLYQFCNLCWVLGVTPVLWFWPLDSEYASQMHLSAPSRFPYGFNCLGHVLAPSCFVMSCHYFSKLAKQKIRYGHKLEPKNIMKIW
jgi:hypothetical protein